ncbi:MAG: amino acid adenylation domain-containing protein [Methylotetracoccus sp.]
MSSAERSNPRDAALGPPDCSGATDLAAVLRFRAARQPARVAYRFLAFGDQPDAVLTYAELDRKARAIGRSLERLRLGGERVLLLYPPGLEYVAAFFGCLYAGAVAVPAYPPARHYLRRLSAIVHDASPRAILTHGQVEARVAEWANADPGSAGLPLIVTDQIESAPADDWHPADAMADGLAFLQYTSGSTGHAKGVAVRHGNLMANQHAICLAFGHDERSTVVGWLPLFHDMGLIGNVLQPLYVGAEAILMPPLAFLEQPLRWLEAISRHRAHTSGGPNFAYELCVRKIAAEHVRSLDLSSWAVAFNGAEAVRARTLSRFSEAFAGAGFRRSAFFPCYGLAEATLFVSGADRTRGPTVRRFDRDVLAKGHAEPADSGETKELASSGRSPAGQRLVIVDPIALTRRADRELGEIWVSGPSVADMYWNRPDDHGEVFGAVLEDEPGRRFLRTGDLGFVDDGELFVTGRSKDLIILRGRNIYPEDIEDAACRVAGIRLGGCAAFSIDDGESERVIAVCEAERGSLRESAGTLAAEVASAIAEACEVGDAHVILVKPGVLPKTSSGKLRRGACRQSFVDGSLPAVASSPASGPAPRDSRDAEPMAPGLTAHKAGVRHWLREQLSRLTGHHEVPADRTLLAIGLDSLRAVDLSHAAARDLGLTLPLSTFMSGMSLDELADWLLSCAGEVTQEGEGIADPSAVSSAERSIWAASLLDRDAVSYNLHTAFRLEGPLDTAAFRDALAEVIGRHAALRTAFSAGGSAVEAEARSLASVPGWFDDVDCAEWGDGRLQTDIARRIREPFDLARGGVLRVALYRHAAERHTVLLGAHHIAIDLWSLLLAMREWGNRYRREGRLLDTGVDRTLIAIREAAYLSSKAARSDWDYWRQRLAGPLPVIDLAGDRARPSAPNFHGASVRVDLDIATTESLRRIAAAHHATLFVMLLAVYKLLLHRVTGQHDLIVGIPSSGRATADVAGTLGNLVNPLAIRTHARPGLRFIDFLHEVRDAVLGGLTHQRFPFGVLVERLQPERVRDRWPIYQTWFVLQQVPGGIDPAWAPLALGEAGARCRWADWTIEPIALADRIEPFDLKVMAAEHADGVCLSFQYRTELLDEATVRRLADQFGVLAASIASAPERRLAELDMLTETERRRVLFDWNDTAVEYDDRGGLLDLFERQASMTPDAIAVSFGDRSLSYRDLHRAANRLANGLLARNLGPEPVVGVCAERSLEMVVSLLGILKSGGAFLPLDPEYPRERLAVMLQDAGAALLIVQPGFDTLLSPWDGPQLILDDCLEALGGFVDTPPPTSIEPGQLAYVLFTSGSTGRPKGVAVPHRGLLNRLLWMQEHFKLGVDDAVLQKTPFSFDVSVWEFFWPLMVGARLVVAEPGVHREPSELAETIENGGVTTVHFVPSMLRAFIDAADFRPCRSLRRVICSGEALPSELHRRFAAASSASLHNLYGPTEASIDVTAWDCGPSPVDTVGVPIGRPIANTSIYLLDRQMQPVPVGVPGELYIGGVGLARGYAGRPDLTAAAFVPSPFSVGERLYRTGDLARYRNDGAIDFLGRIDHQVKLRGFRIELGEIEQALRSLPGITDAAVMLGDEGTGHPRLVAYLVGAAEDADASAVWRRALAERLPDYMIPGAFVHMSALPLTPSGKLDRKALPLVEAASGRDYVAPRNAIERLLARIWSEVLRVEQIGIDDDFFALGGDSILGIQIASRARAEGLTFSARSVFHFPTIATLAPQLRLQETNDDVARCPVRPPFALADLPAGAIAELQSRWPEMEDLYPLTPMQEGMLFFSLMHPGSGIYVMQDQYTIAGAVDPDAFRAAWQHVVDRHPVLRSAFVWQGLAKPHQWVRRNAELPYEMHDWRSWSPERQHHELDALLEAERRSGFDLQRAPLLRIRLIRLADEHWRCVRSFHHILLDEWCTSPLFLEFRAAYLGLVDGGGLPKLPEARPFRDFIDWLRRQDPSAAEQFWRRELDGFSEPTPLVVDRAGGAAPTVAVDDVECSLTTKQTALLVGRVQAGRMTANTLVQAAWALVLSRYASRTDVVFGVTVAGRPVDLPDIERTLGLFINTLPLRLKVRPEQPVSEFWSEILERNLAIRQFEHVPLVQIQGWSDVPSGTDLFNHLLVYENAPIDPSLLDEHSALDMRYHANRVHTNYPVTVTVVPGECLLLRMTYQPVRIAAADAARMLGHFRQVLVRMMEHPDALLGSLSLPTESEWRQQRDVWNDTSRHFPQGDDFVAAFLRQVAATPSADAARCGADSLSYAGLDRASERLARWLRTSGVGNDDVVVLMDRRGLDLLVMMVAVLKAGAAFLSLDPRHPPARWSSAVAASRARVALCGEDFIDALRAAVVAEDLELSLRVLSDTDTGSDDDSVPLDCSGNPDQLAYLIFTSGSTGVPKGAMITRQGMINNLLTKIPALGLGTGDVIAQTAPQSFDISIWQFLTPLLCGACTDILADAVAQDPAALLRAIGERNVSILECVPSLMRALLDQANPDASLPGLRWLLPTGEALPPDLCIRWRRRFPDVGLLNAYGPAECADDVSYHRIDAIPESGTLRVPIGRPVANLRLFVLDAAGHPVPIGVPGEICVGGAGVGRGYAGRPDLTAAAFVPDPFGAPGTRLYRTGDLGCWREDGLMEYLGRIDHQVKIRGVRLELEEVEAQLAQHPDVAAAAARVWTDARGEARLVAYAVAREPGRSTDERAIRAFLTERLPEYALPGALVWLADLPLGPNGKLDRTALPRPQGDAESVEPRQAPATPSEELVAGVWMDVLGAACIGRDDHFFERGGHSLLATQLIARLNPLFGVELPFRTLWEHPSLRELAEQIDRLVAYGAGSKDAPLVAEPRSADAPYPLSAAQRRLWFMLQMDPNNSFYHFSTAVRVSGELDIAALEFAVQRIVERHRALRAVFSEQDGEPVQRFLSTVEIRPRVDELSDVMAGDADERLRKQLIAAHGEPFDLARGPLLRVRVIRLPRESEPVCAVLFCFHHIVFDGWSFGVFLAEFCELYRARLNGTTAHIDDLPIDFGDYVLWQREQLGGARSSAVLDHWLTALHGAPMVLDLPTDRPRPPGGDDSAATHAFVLSPTSEALTASCQKLGVTPFMAVLAGLGAWVRAVTGRADFIIGADVANRTLRELEPLIGFFINLVALRIRVEGDPRFAEFAAAVRRTTLDAYAHQDLPFDRLVDALRPQRSAAYSPVFQIKLVFHNVPLNEADLRGLRLEPIGLPVTRNEHDLVLHVYPGADGMRCVFEYRTALFDRETIEFYSSLLDELITRAVSEPDSRLSGLVGSVALRLAQWRSRQNAERRSSGLAQLAATKRRRLH